jgi:hypothetical protein
MRCSLLAPTACLLLLGCATREPQLALAWAAVDVPVLQLRSFGSISGDSTDYRVYRSGLLERVEASFGREQSVVSVSLPEETLESLLHIVVTSGLWALDGGELQARMRAIREQRSREYEEREGRPAPVTVAPEDSASSQLRVYLQRDEGAVVANQVSVRGLDALALMYPEIRELTAWADLCKILYGVLEEASAP